MVASIEWEGLLGDVWLTQMVTGEMHLFAYDAGHVALWCTVTYVKLQ